MWDYTKKICYIYYESNFCLPFQYLFQNSTLMIKVKIYINFLKVSYCLSQKYYASTTKHLSRTEILLTITNALYKAVSVVAKRKSKHR